jgi:hypothetical protein
MELLRSLAEALVRLLAAVDHMVVLVAQQLLATVILVLSAAVLSFLALRRLYAALDHRREDP